MGQLHTLVADSGSEILVLDTLVPYMTPEFLVAHMVVDCILGEERLLYHKVFESQNNWFDVSLCEMRVL